MKHSKKLLALLLTLIMAVGVLTISASASYYQITSGTGFSVSIDNSYDDDYDYCNETHQSAGDFVSAHSGLVDDYGTVITINGDSGASDKAHYISTYTGAVHYSMSGGTLVIDNTSTSYVVGTSNSAKLEVKNSGAIVYVRGTFGSIKTADGVKVIMEGDLTISGSSSGSATVEGNASYGLTLSNAKQTVTMVDADSTDLEKAEVTDGTLDLHGADLYSAATGQNQYVLHVTGGTVKSTAEGTHTITGMNGDGIIQEGGTIELTGYTVTSNGTNSNCGSMNHHALHVTNTADPANNMYSYGGKTYVVKESKLYDTSSPDTEITEESEGDAYGVFKNNEFVYNGETYGFTLAPNARFASGFTVGEDAVTDENLIAQLVLAAPQRLFVTDVFTNCTFVRGNASRDGSTDNIVYIAGGAVRFDGGSIAGQDNVYSTDQHFCPRAMYVTGGKVTIDGMQISSYCSDTLKIADNTDVLITGNATVTNSNTVNGSAIAVSGASAKLTVMAGNANAPTITGLYGIKVASSAMVNVVGTASRPVVIGNCGVGINVDNGKVAVAYANINANNVGTKNYGVQATGTTEVKLLSGTVDVSSGDTAYGVYATGGAKVTISGGTITSKLAENGEKKAYGVYAESGAQVTIKEIKDEAGEAVTPLAINVLNPENAYTTGNYYGVYATGASTKVDFKGGAISVTSTNDNQSLAGVYVDTGATFNFTGGTLNVKGDGSKFAYGIVNNWVTHFNGGNVNLLSSASVGVKNSGTFVMGGDNQTTATADNMPAITSSDVIPGATSIKGIQNEDGASYINAGYIYITGNNGFGISNEGGNTVVQVNVSPRDPAKKDYVNLLTVTVPQGTAFYSKTDGWQIHGTGMVFEGERALDIEAESAANKLTGGTFIGQMKYGVGQPLVKLLDTNLYLRDDAGIAATKYTEPSDGTRPVAADKLANMGVVGSYDGSNTTYYTVTDAEWELRYALEYVNEISDYTMPIDITLDANVGDWYGAMAAQGDVDVTKGRTVMNEDGVMLDAAGKTVTEVQKPFTDAKALYDQWVADVAQYNIDFATWYGIYTAYVTTNGNDEGFDWTANPRPIKPVLAEGVQAIVNAGLEAYPFTPATEGAHVLDVNGKTLSGSVTDAAHNAILHVSETGELLTCTSVEGGLVQNTGTKGSALRINNGGVATNGVAADAEHEIEAIPGVTLLGKGSNTVFVAKADGDTACGTYIQNSGSVGTADKKNEAGIYISSGTDNSVVIYDGTVFGSENGIHVRYAGTVNVYGGTIDGGANGIYNQMSGKLNVYGGTITGNKDGINQSNGTTTVTGGTIRGNGTIAADNPETPDVNEANAGIKATAGTLNVTPATATTITGAQNGINMTAGTAVTIDSTNAALKVTGTTGDGINVKANTITMTLTDKANVSGGTNGVVADCTGSVEDCDVSITNTTVTGTTGSGVYLQNGKMTATNSTLQGATYGLKMEGNNSTATVNNCQLLCTKKATDYPEGTPDTTSEAGLCFMGKSLTIDNAVTGYTPKPVDNEAANLTNPDGFNTQIIGGYNGIYYNSNGTLSFGKTVYVEGVHNGAMIDCGYNNCGINGGYIKGGVNGVVTKGYGNFQVESGTIYGAEYGILLENGGDVDFNVESTATATVIGGIDGVRAITDSSDADVKGKGGTILGGYLEDGVTKVEDTNVHNGITIVRSNETGACIELTAGTVTGTTNGIGVTGAGTDTYTVSITNTNGNVAITGENGDGIKTDEKCTTFTLNSTSNTNTLKVEGKNGDGINVTAGKITMTLTDKAEIIGSKNGIVAVDNSSAENTNSVINMTGGIVVGAKNYGHSVDYDTGVTKILDIGTTGNDGCEDGINVGANVTLNVSGGSVAGYQNGIDVAATGTANVSGGTIIGGTNGVNVATGATANVSGGTINGATGILTAGTTTVTTVADGTTTVTGTTDGVKVTAGTTNIAGNAAVQGKVTVEASGTVNMTGGTAMQLASAGTTNVSGGKITGDSTISGGTTTVTGGEFVGDVTVSGGELKIEGDSNSFPGGATKLITVTNSGKLIVTDLTGEGHNETHTTVARKVVRSGAGTTVSLGVGTQYKSLSTTVDNSKLADMLAEGVTNVQDTSKSNVYEVNGAELQKKVEGSTPETLTASADANDNVYFLLTRNDAVQPGDVALTDSSITANTGAVTGYTANTSVTLDRVALRNTTNGYSFTLTAGTAAEDATNINRQIKWTANNSGITFSDANGEALTLSYEGDPVTVTVSKDLVAGTYTITATSVQESTKSDTFTVTVAKTSLNGATVTLNPESGNYVYTGNEITAQVASVKVTVNGTDYTLVEGADKDYTVSGNVQTDANNYTLTVTAVDSDCSGSKADVAWKITEQNIANATVTITPSSYTADNTAKTPTISVKYGNTPLNEGTDYTVTGDKTGTTVGTYTITITGAGNYAGTMTATWKINSAGGGGFVPTPTYTITCGTGVKADAEEATAGKTITLTVSEGYENIVVKDADGKAVTVTGNTFKMPASDVKVTVSVIVIEPETITYDKCLKDSDCVLTAFNDIEPAKWYHDGIHYCLDNGMMNGLGNGKFGPFESTTRAMIFTILARLDGQTITSTGANWYADGQAWAVKSGVSDGTNPTANITREQLAAMLYRYATLKGYDVSASGELTTFGDYTSVSSYAVEAMQWAVGAGIITGNNGNLKPTDGATRAEVATMLMRFCELIVK